MWEGEQVAKWAGEAGLPAWQVEAAWQGLKERGLWEATLGTLTSQESEDKSENPTKEKRMVILFMTSTRVQYGAMSQP